MGYQIIKQPNGKYCFFNNNVDNVTHYDMTEIEIVETLTDISKSEHQRKVKEILEDLEAGKKPYHNFTMSFDEMIEEMESRYGKESVLDVKTKMSESKFIPDVDTGAVYTTAHETKQLNELLKRDDTIHCWIATRINGASASMACDGNISMQLLKMLDEKILPLIKKEKK